MDTNEGGVWRVLAIGALRQLASFQLEYGFV